MAVISACGRAAHSEHAELFMSEALTQSHHAFLAAAEQAEWKPANYFERAKLSEIFPREAPIEVDFGCGEGAFLLARAQQKPERNFLGTERMLGRVTKVCRAIARQGLSNVRLLRLENAWATKHLLPLECVSIAHVAFPDPWPKRHHQPRRLVQVEFLEGIRTMLTPDGELRLKTDDLPYFQWMEKVIALAPGYERIEWEDEPDYPITNFERRFLLQGLPIYRARLRKI